MGGWQSPDTMLRNSEHWAEGVERRPEAGFEGSERGSGVQGRAKKTQETQSMNRAEMLEVEAWSLEKASYKTRGLLNRDAEVDQPAAVPLTPDPRQCQTPPPQDTGQKWCLQAFQRWERTDSGADWA